MKRLSLLLVVVFALNVLLAGVAFGENEVERVFMRFWIGERTYHVNDVPVEMDAAPILIEGKTMLPIRFVATPLGANVTWDRDEQKVTVRLDGKTVELWVDENTARVNGKPKMIDPDNPEVKPLLVPPGRTMLPLRFISENLGSKVDWCPDRKEATVAYPVNLAPKKETVLIIEGMEEKCLLNLRVSPLFPYAIYVDEDRYHMDQKEGKDVILPRADVSPEVFMSFTHRPDVEPSLLVAEMQEALRENYAQVQFRGYVEMPLPSYFLYASGGDAWNDPVERCYLVEDFDGGAFIIRQRLFTEAEEGHGARFDAMLKEFFVWHAGKGKYFPPGAVANNEGAVHTSCWDYQPLDMAPKAGWEDAELEGLSREQLVEVLGCPPHVIRMTSVVGPDYNRELWVYHPYDQDPTGLFVWLKGEAFHHSTLNEFSGFWCYEMTNPDFWD